LVEKGKKRKVSVYPVFVDLLSFPLDSEPVEVSGYQMPRKFKTTFLIEDEDSKIRTWSLELIVEIGELGTPKILEVTPRGLSDQDEIWLDGSGEYLFKEPHDSVTPRQLEILQMNYRRFVVCALQVAIQSHTYEGDGINHKWTFMGKSRDVPRQDLISFGKEMANLTSRTRLTNEFLKQVEREHLELKKAAKGRKFRGNEILAQNYLVEVKTIESWLAKAKKISVTKTGSKKITQTKRKGVNK
jgi:hypothetical protein